MSARKTATGRQRLLEAAKDLFAERWYESVSIVEICKHADLSNGAFYKHFPNKESIFLSLIQEYLVFITDRFSVVEGETVRERLITFLDRLLQANREDWKYINIFREAELRYPEYEQQLRKMYMTCLEGIFERKISEAEYLYILGGIRFMVRRPAFHECNVTSELLANYILEGLLPAPNEHPAESRYLSIPESPPLTPLPENTKKKLVQAGLDLFGSKGFHVVNVFEIAQQAGFSVGTFYLHFTSKEEFLDEVIRHISLEIRWYIALRSDPTLPRLYSELLALRLFLHFFSSHKEYYQIAREAEFTPTKAMAEYYDGFEQTYIQTFDSEQMENPRVVANYLMGLAHYAGIEYIFSRTVEDVTAVLKELEQLLQKGVKS
ncbi:MAG: TetR family transcriptional regulator [Spirochaetaceae bacterium]|nr:MAG: TetR family transcriptional regulator [Spirochaetaceae bacterium]